MGGELREMRVKERWDVNGCRRGKEWVRRKMAERKACGKDGKDGKDKEEGALGRE